MPKLQIGLVVGAAAVLGLVLVSVIANLEKVERVVHTPPQAEARRNPLLAAERFLRAMGIKSHSAARLGELPSTDHVLILAVENRILTRSRTDRLLDWMSHGGFLIFSPYLENGEPAAETWNDPLLDELGIGVEKYEQEPERDRREVVKVRSFRDDRTFDVEFYADFALTLPYEVDEEANEEPDLYAMLSGRYGDGGYVALQDLRFLRSDAIGQHDHAAFLWDLFERGGNHPEALLIHGWGYESIWLVLSRRAWPVLLAVALLLGGWLWARAARFGPPIPAPAPGSRALLEHVDGLGWFLWRAGRADVLVDSARRDLRRRVLARRPDFATLGREEQLATLALGVDLPEQAVAAAWFGAAPRRRDELTRRIRTLQRIRREW